MPILAVAQNEYAIIDPSFKKYDGLCTYSLHGCIGIIAHSPETQTKFLAHLDAKSSIAETATILMELQKDNKPLNITIIERETQTQHANLTLLNIKSYFERKKLEFNTQKTQTGTVVINAKGEIQTNWKVLASPDFSEKILQQSESLFPICEKLEFSKVSDVQWNITNLNNVVDKIKPLHKAILDNKLLNEVEELLDMELINILEKAATQYPSYSSTPEEVKKYLYTELWNNFGEKNYKKNEQFNLEKFQKDSQAIMDDRHPYLLFLELGKIKENMQLQYKTFLVDLAYKFLPQVAILKAKHSPRLGKDNQPTDNWAFYAPIVPLR